MIGVVLWSDPALRKAVIWCEDQGDLAFCRQDSDTGGPNLYAGDWVTFDLMLAGNLRFAENPVVVEELGCPDLAQRLVSAAAGTDSTAASGADAETGKIIPFPAKFRKPAAAAVVRRSLPL